MASNVFIQRMFVTICPLMETFAVQRDQKVLQVLLHATDFVTGNGSLRCDTLLKVIPGAVRWVLWFVWGCSRAQVAPTAPQNLPVASWRRVHPHHTQHSCALGSWGVERWDLCIVTSSTAALLIPAAAKATYQVITYREMCFIEKKSHGYSNTSVWFLKLCIILNKLGTIWLKAL